MPRLIQSIDKDVIKSYDGYDAQKVGMGLINPNAYATDAYRKTKIKTIFLGGITSMVYSGFDHDPTPTILSLFYEPAYNTIMALNLRYSDERIRRAIMKHVLEANKVRIKANQPMMVSWSALQRAVPPVAYITRRYKIVGIGVKETFPLVEWPEVAKEKSPYDGMWRRFKSGNV